MWRTAGRFTLSLQGPPTAASRQTRMKQWSSRMGQRCSAAMAGMTSRVSSSQRATSVPRRDPGSASGLAGHGSGVIAVRGHGVGGTAEISLVTRPRHPG